MYQFKIIFIKFAAYFDQYTSSSSPLLSGRYFESKQVLLLTCT